GRLDDAIVEKREFTTITLGKSDFEVSGPLIEGLRRRRSEADRNLGQKILGFPLVRLFVPQRMPSPPQSGGKYFAWRRESSQPWVSIASGAGVAAGPANHEPQALISLGK